MMRAKNIDGDPADEISFQMKMNFLGFSSLFSLTLERAFGLRADARALRPRPTHRSLLEEKKRMKITKEIGSS